MSYFYQETTIGQLCRDGGGNVQTGPFGSQLKASAYVADGIPTIMPADIIDFRVSDKEIARIGAEDHKRLSRHQLRPGDIVYGRRGDIGRHALITEREAGWLCGTGCLRIRFGNAPIEPRYISYYLRQGFVIDRILGMAVGSTMPNLNTSILESVPILLPPLPVQRRIAEILGRLDDKIEVNRRINRTLEAMAQTLYKNWFVDFGPFQDGEFVESELGLIPQGCTTKSVYACAQYINGAAYRSFAPNDEQRGRPIIKIAELKNGVTGQTLFSDVEVDPKYHIDNGEILFSWSGNPDTSIDIFTWVGGPAYLNQHIFRILPFVPNEKYIVYFMLKSLIPVFAEKARNKQTTGLGHVTVSDLKQMQVVWPSDTDLQKFTARVASLYELRLTNLLETQKLTEIRDYLLPKLLSSEIPVEAVTEQVDDVTKNQQQQLTLCI